jgi:hypothetical protein
MIVTSYYDLYNNPNKINSYIYKFYDLAVSGLQIIVFTDPKLVNNFNGLPSSVTIIGIPLETFELYSIANKYDKSLPDIRNVQKDTKEFLGFLNTKIEFILKASEISDDNTFIWMDIGILNNIKDKDRFISKLKILDKKQYSKIIIPGFFDIGSPFTVDEINCRFNGSFFIMPRKYIKIFYGHSKNVLTDFCTLSQYKLCWETNIWYIVEACAMRDDINWYFADKDDSLINDIDIAIAISH